MGGQTGDRGHAARAAAAPISPSAGQYLPGLDGIRGLAVAAVLLYHADLPLGEGGFLGVSAFFTLSGFLITSILLREHDSTGRFDLRAFWVRRCRRLLPAAALGLAAVAVFGFTVASPQQLRDLPAELLSSLAFVTNWHLMAAGRSYADLFADPSPLQHFWSLAVEWQLYVALPLLLALVLARARSQTARVACVAAGVAASAGLMAVLALRGASLDRLYYGTDTRAAELLAGALLAVALHGRDLAATGRWRRWLGVAGTLALAGLLAAYLLVPLDDERLYRGGFLVVSALTALIIAAIRAGTGPVAALHSWGPLAYLGRLSYGLYVVHWPVYVWLDERETGLEGWPLLALRLAIALPLAAASFHLVEQPIRQGRWSGRRPSLGWAAGLAAVCLLAAAAGLRQLDADIDLAGLGEPVAAMPDRPSRGDGVLDVLVVADPEESAVVEELVARQREADDLRVTVAAPFACDGTDGSTCTNWQAEWPRLVAEVDPDVVLLRKSGWDAAAVAALAGTDDLDEQVAWTERVLAAGLDLLTARGAAVVWSTAPSDFATALRLQRDPFDLAMRRLGTRPDVRRHHTATSDVDVILADLRLYARHEVGDVPRVLVVGDSTGRTLGYGLERWADETGAIVVWTTAVEGCGVVVDGTVREIGAPDEGAQLPEQCSTAVTAWPEQVEAFDPDVVVVMSTVSDLRQRRLPGWPGFLEPGDAAFDDHLLDEYVAAYDILAAGGAEVVWVRVPCTGDLGPLFRDGSGPADTVRIRHVDEVLLPRLVETRPQLRVFDMDAILCPDGEAVTTIGESPELRPDGVHFSAEGSVWFARTYGPELLGLRTAPRADS